MEDLNWRSRYKPSEKVYLSKGGYTLYQVSFQVAIDSVQNESPL